MFVLRYCHAQTRLMVHLILAQTVTGWDDEFILLHVLTFADLILITFDALFFVSLAVGFLNRAVNLTENLVLHGVLDALPMA